MAQPIYDKLIEQHLKILQDLQYRSGLFAASKKGAAQRDSGRKASGLEALPGGVDTGYDKAWLRDNFYETMAF